MLRKILAIGLLGMVSTSQAILLERAEQGSYNNRAAPQVNQEEARLARTYPQAPRANTGYKSHIYTYDNNVSEYLRDNLNLPKEQADYQMQAASYLKTKDQLPQMNSTFPVLEREKAKDKAKYENLHSEK